MINFAKYKINNSLKIKTDKQILNLAMYFVLKKNLFVYFLPI